MTRYKILLILFTAAALFFGYLLIAGAEETGPTTDEICLAQNIYHEARGESAFGQLMVALVTINRLNSDIAPFNKYKSICDVVFDGGYGPTGATTCQFAWTCDSIPDFLPKHYMKQVKENLLPILETSTLDDCYLYYHADDGRERGWIQRGGLTDPLKVGNHLFYKDPSCK